MKKKLDKKQKKMGFWSLRTEGILRMSAIICLGLTVLLLGFDKQTIQIFHVQKKASFTSLHALVVIIYVHSLAAAYNILQLCKCWISAQPKGASKMIAFNIYLFWISFLLDQAAVYVVFSANMAGVEAGLLAITGTQNFQWMKVCYKLSRFCYQAGGAFVCGYGAFLAMVAISIISAFNLFRHYSPNHFLGLKSNE